MKRALIVGKRAEYPDSRWDGLLFGFDESLRLSLSRRGWHVDLHSRSSGDFHDEPDLIVGWGWNPAMAAAHELWPERVLCGDLGVWGRAFYQGIRVAGGYYRLVLGGRWSPLRWHEGLDGSRAAALGVTVRSSKPPGVRVLVAGLSRESCNAFGLEFQAWERKAVDRLLCAGAVVTYRVKPCEETLPISGAEFDKGSSSAVDALQEVDAVAAYCSNMTVEAVAAGLPVFCEVGYAKSVSVESVEALVGAMAVEQAIRERFCAEVAWHQWTLPEIASGAWLNPPAPLSGMFDA